MCLERIAVEVSRGHEQGEGKFTFAVPAGAFGVDALEELLVGLAGPLKACVQLIFIHLVIVVNELLALLDGVIVV